MQQAALHLDAPRSPAPRAVSKSEFAAIIGVSKGRVSQYLAAGHIAGEAIEGEGRDARIVVDVAKAQLARRLDPAQMTGNGFATRIEAAPPPASTVEPTDPTPGRDPGTGGPGSGGPGGGDATPPAPPAPPRPPSPEDQLVAEMRREQLAAMRRKREREEAEDAERRGLYTLTEDVQTALVRLAGSMLSVFEGALPDLAAAMAAEFKVPQRDALHMLRRTFRDVRAKAAAAAANNAANLDQLVEPAGDEGEE